MKQQPLPLAFLALLASFTTYSLWDTRVESIDINEFTTGYQQCFTTQPNSTLERSRNPRFKIGNIKPHEPILFKNCVIWSDGVLTTGQDVLISDGIIKQVGINLKSLGARVIDVNGHFLTPGLVDMHSHMGTDSWPVLNGNSDTNEFSQVMTPQVKSLDGFNTWDPAIEIINSGGVTTSLVLPGSSNLMGGEAFAVKHLRPPSNRAEDMLLNAGIPDHEHKWRWMKFACGENPRNSYGAKAMPESRLGEGWLLRSRFEKALQLKLQQDDWCSKAKYNVARHGISAHMKMKTRFPTRLEDESLVALLRRNVLLNVHCYETYDLEMIVRLSKDFNFDITAFHHALEAWRVPDLLAKNNISAAIFADHWGYKKEAYDTSVKAAQILTKAGVKVAFKSDHPVLNAQNLIFEAQKAHHYGLSAELAIKAVTSVPAERIGQGHRLGHIKEGYDADIVIWNQNPLELGAHPLQVYVDGTKTFEHSDFNGQFKQAEEAKISEPPKVEKVKASTSQRQTYVNIKGLVSGPDAKQEENSKIVVENGIITCLGNCEVIGDVVDLNGGWVTPGLIGAGLHLGLQEISQEPITGSGRIKKAFDAQMPLQYPKAASSIYVGRNYSRILNSAFKAGITTSISVFEGDQALLGWGTAIRTGATRHDKAFVKRNVLVHAQMGVSENTFSDDLEQFATATRHLVTVSHPEYVAGIAVAVSGSDRISELLSTFNSLKNRLKPLNLTIVGGEEAWHVADLIQNSASVILKPARCTPSLWFTQRCKVTATTPSAVEILLKNGVNLGLSVPEDNFIRGLIWEAGWAIKDCKFNLSEFEKAKMAVGLVTWNIANAYGIPERGYIQKGHAPNFVVYSDVPGSLKAKVLMVVDGDIVETDTEQY